MFLPQKNTIANVMILYLSLAIPIRKLSPFDNKQLLLTQRIFIFGDNTQTKIFIIIQKLLPKSCLFITIPQNEISYSYSFHQKILKKPEQILTNFKKSYNLFTFRFEKAESFFIGDPP